MSHDTLLMTNSRQIHALGLAYRAMDLTKIIKTGQNRIRLGSISIKDLLAGSQDDIQNLNRSSLYIEQKI